MSTFGYTDASEEIRGGVRAMIERTGFATTSIAEPRTVDRAVINVLRVAYCDAVREEFENAVKAAGSECVFDLSVAKQMMKDDGFITNPICSIPGMKPMVAKVDLVEVVSFEDSMGLVVPLSAIYLNKVRSVTEVCAKLAKDRAAEGEKNGTSSGAGSGCGSANGGTADSAG